MESMDKVLNQVLNFNAKTMLSFPPLWVEVGVGKTEEVEEALDTTAEVGKTVDAGKTVEVGNIAEVGAVLESGNIVEVGRTDDIEDSATLEKDGEEGLRVGISVVLGSDEDGMLYDDMEEAMV